MLIDRIAAGEVVERPAAALKELVENALDAGATRIEVAIDGGGIDRIEVADDGTGMAAAELALAVQRHATSKLVDDDLVRIATLGFRGEALPSIGAAARLAIISRDAAADHASRITVEGGLVGAVSPAAGARGTTVTVRDLFHATPARRKFLKSIRAETDAAETALRRLAYAAPGCGFSLRIDGKLALDLPPQPRPARIAALAGADAAACLLMLDHRHGDLHLGGAAAAASYTRPTAANQSLVVNGRPVTDPVLRTALRVAYRNVIAAGRHPYAALYLTVPEDAVDVNVHPAKAELRFRDPDAIRALVIGGLQRAIAAPADPLADSAPHAWASRSLSHTPRPALVLRPPPAPGLAEARLDFGAPPAARVLPAPMPQPGQPLGAPLGQILDTYVLSVDQTDRWC